MSQEHGRRRRRLRWQGALVTTWLVALAAYVLLGIALVPFHGDEATQVYLSRDYAIAVLQGDPVQLVFREPPLDPTAQDLRIVTNGSVARYLIGLAWHAGGFTAADLNEQWDWGADWAHNQATGHAPSAALLVLARLPQVMLLALGVAVLFQVARQLGGVLAGVAAATIYALHPALLVAGRRAMMEASLVLGTLLTVIAAGWWLARPGWRRALLFGLAAGLTVAAKQSAVFVAVPLLVLGAAWTVAVAWRGGGGAARRLAEAALAAGAAACLFLLLTPVLLHDPLARLAEVLAARTAILELQVALFGGYGSLADQLAGFWRQAFEARPQYFEVIAWADYVGDPIGVYEASPWAGLLLPGPLRGVLLAGLAAAGLVWLLGGARPRRPMTWVAIVWTVGAAAGAGPSPLEWQRYYVPLYPPLALLAGLGIGAVAAAVQELWRRRAVSPAPDAVRRSAAPGVQ